MPAPGRVVLRVGSIDASAYIVEVESTALELRVVCKSCAPLQTDMLYIGAVIYAEYPVTHTYWLYRCQRCQRQWAMHVQQTAVIEDVTE